MYSPNGFNPITSKTNDTTVQWGKLGPGYWMFNIANVLNDQPSQYGILLNFPVNRSSEVHQIWFVQASGAAYHRGGNGSGWSGTWKLFSQGTANAAQVLSGYTFSSANGSNISGTMVNRGNLNWNGSNTTYSVPAGYYSGGTLNSKTSYNNGYNAGVTAADNRANTNSTNYKTGYNAGYSAGREVKHITGTVTSSTSTYGWKYYDSKGNIQTAYQYYLDITLDFSHRVLTGVANRTDYGEQYIVGTMGTSLQLNCQRFIFTQHTHPGMATDVHWYFPVVSSGRQYNYELWYI